MRPDERFLALDERFLVLRLAADFFDARFGERFAELLRAELDFLALDLRPLDFLALDLRPPPLLRAPPRADDLRAGDLRPADLRPLFFARFEPPRDDFLAAAMLRAPI